MSETATATFTLRVNGQSQTTQARTLQEWVQAQGVAPEVIATAVNGAFVPRSLRAQHLLADGDEVLTFQPIEGG